MELKILLSFFLMISGSFCNQLKFFNNCPFSVWPGVEGNPGKAHLENGGFKLLPYETKAVNTPGDWAGKIWARTKCDGSGRCQTGDCANKIQCNGTMGVPPFTLAEIKLKDTFKLDWYDISLLNGYNIPIKILPTDGYITPSNKRYDCKAATCEADLNARCPSELAVKLHGTTVACKSACEAFNTDEYCCRGVNNSKEMCNINKWPINYPAIFKSACPYAFSHPYDDATSVFTCRGNPETNYDIIFCPFSMDDN
ncbi:pathogenesis-related protein 5-like [Aphidius gifuensis]|uniref:pathogenesis-related protein 5-like n=1 Tax=Aphidius gifuensis TaxID=684658 RepID=UPI001CDBE96C|nr:pathogenesis-related protein 5-like [Aphidius gifuensis]